MMKTVAIVGAGPAGLAAAKHLIHHGSKSCFQVTVFEKQAHVGGMWALKRRDTSNGKCSPNMRVNLSRFTVAFDGFPWSDEDACENGPYDEDEHGDRDRAKNTAQDAPLPMFPRAWQVGRYLQRYAREFIPASSIRLGCTVTQATREENGTNKQWRIRWVSNTDNHEEEVFDYLIAAPGFFFEPSAASFSVNGPDGATGQVIHSSKFRGQCGLSENHSKAPQKIVVVGGSMSGAEAAATAAFEISNSKHSLASTTNLENHQVFHVFNRPFYPIPRFLVPAKKGDHGLEETGPVPDILPVDLALFNYGNDRPPKVSRGAVTPEKANETHRFFASVLGGNPEPENIDLPREILHSDIQRNYPPFVAITDDYPSYVRSGAIVPIRGHVTNITEHNSPSKRDETDSKVDSYLTVNVHCGPQRYGGDDTPWSLKSTGPQDTQKITLSDVDAVIYATGYESYSALRWLPSDILDTLQHDPKSRRMPLILTQHCTGAINSSNLAFVGFYEGPYWGVMEMQAEYIAQKWAAELSDSSLEVEQTFQDGPNESNQIIAVREAQLKHDPSIPQFWMGDHIGVRREIAAKLQRLGGVDNGIESTLANHLHMEARMNTFRQNHVGDLYVPAAVFRSLHGRWELKRILNSKLPGFPSGTFNGSAEFHPRKPTSEDADEEYLFIESGTLRTNEGFEMQASRRYVYRYNATPPTITAWFVKGDGMTVDYFFHEVSHWSRSSEATHPSKSGWRAQSEHLCVKDMYYPEYLFQFRGSSVEKFNIKYTVKGPQKDYVSDTWLTRAPPPWN